MAASTAGCSSPPDNLARLGSEAITVADLDAHLLALPEAERQVPAGNQPAAWLEEQLRGLALERVLQDSDEMARLEAGPEEEARRLWLRSSALASALVQELARAAAPDAGQVAAKAAELAEEIRGEPLLNFQHVYFRLDRATTPRAKEMIRARARTVAAEAMAGADFPALAREHSNSADAAGGGLVVNARPSDLDPESRRVLAALAEDQVSPLVETRTGLHVFRLVRRLAPEPPTSQQLEIGARRLLQRKGFAAAREALLEELRERIDADVETSPWHIGSWVLESEILDELMPEEAGEGERGGELLIEHFLLAEEALRRGLETPEMKADLARRSRRLLLALIFDQRRRAFDAEIAEETLRRFHEAQPSLFNEAEKTRLELIFVPQERDSFAAQQRSEGYVADLRAGASFAALARRVSKGKSADGGGDLGLLEPQQWARLGPAVSAAIPGLAVGEISEPIYCTDRILGRDPELLRGGFAILRVAERIAERPRSFEEAADDVRRAYASERREELDRELRRQILDEAGFELLRLPEPAEFLR